MKISLPQNSVNLLAQCLALAGWAEGPADIYLAGRLLASDLPELPPQPKDEADLKQWADARREFDITEKERAVIVRCLNKTAKHLPIDRNGHSAALLAALGLTE
jgi:hypothetical protein